MSNAEIWTMVCTLGGVVIGCSLFWLFMFVEQSWRFRRMRRNDGE